VGLFYRKIHLFCREIGLSLLPTVMHTATRCNTLQHTATHCNTLQRAAIYLHTHTHTHTDCTVYRIVQTYDAGLHSRRRPTHTPSRMHTHTHVYTNIYTQTHTHTHVYTNIYTITHILANRCLFLPHPTHINQKIISHTRTIHVHKHTNTHMQVSFPTYPYHRWRQSSLSGVCCSVLQCVAVCCSVLHCVALC